jgi:hypothetical protein
MMGQRVSLTRLAHEAITPALREGGKAVDATVGNGHDLAFLAAGVGAAGKVWGFDVQEQALTEARHRLPRELASRVTLLHAGHEQLGAHVDGPLDAVMFNLGYLPGGDHAVTTSAGTTIVALEAATSRLRSGGRMTVLAYTGHPGGDAESTAVEAWCKRLSANYRWQLLNPTPPTESTPRLYLVERV